MCVYAVMTEIFESTISDSMLSYHLNLILKATELDFVTCHFFLYCSQYILVILLVTLNVEFQYLMFLEKSYNQVHVQS